MNPSERFKEYLSTTPTRHYGACEAQLNEAINEIDELTADLARAMAVVEAARNVCRDGMTQRLIDEIAAFDAAKEKP